MSIEDLLKQVQECKVVLESNGSSEDLLGALLKLKKCGCLPTKVLGDTLIGKTVNAVAKGAEDDAVRTKAKDLVDYWRQALRKRKSSGDLSQPALKRGLSSSLSLCSEALAGKDLAASQDSQPPASQGSAEGPALARADSLLSLGQESFDASGAPKGPVDAYRTKVQEKLAEAFGKAEDIETKEGSEGGEEQMRDPVELSVEIDEALHSVFPKKDEYLAQARSVLYNLKDKKNPTFRFKVLVGFFKPSQVPKLTAEDMASIEKSNERAKQRKYAMEEIQADWALKHGQLNLTGMFTCGKCKGTKTTYFQMQTRSSDEPMTTFVSCLTCNNRWKFC
mmetsp:Transcript_19496/g.54450  ORF Transcript_19496/g.54450 Transcript_19496/m.54450 type:complete len:335 (-) Transcript_19496:129-1133(-)